MKLTLNEELNIIKERFKILNKELFLNKLLNQSDQHITIEISNNCILIHLISTLYMNALSRESELHLINFNKKIILDLIVFKLPLLVNDINIYNDFETYLTTISNNISNDICKDLVQFKYNLEIINHSDYILIETNNINNLAPINKILSYYTSLDGVYKNYNKIIDYIILNVETKRIKC